MNELKHIVEKYGLNKQECIIHFHKEDRTTKKSLEHIVEFIPCLIDYERPDMYAKIDNELLFIEHFQFDSSENLQFGGSTQKHEEVRVERKFQSAVSNSEDGTVYVHDGIQAKQSLDNYKNNLFSSFKKHYKKIPYYIERLILDGIAQSNDHIIKGFFIDDTSSLGNFFMSKDDKPLYLNLMYADFFWEFIKEYRSGLDFILFGLFNGKENIIYFFDLKSEYDYKNHLFEITEENYFSFSPNVISYSVAIPNSKENKYE